MQENSKIIFLDFDGVLITENTGYLLIDKTPLQNLVDLIEKTDAKVVVSSSWRLCPITCMNLMKGSNLDKYLHKNWSTPEFDMNMPEYRGHEINSWYEHNGNGASYVILDDCEPMLPFQESHYVKTNEKIGLTSKDCELAYQILMNGELNV